MVEKRVMNDRQGMSDAGFTLIEVLIGMAILGIGILAVASMQISSINGNASAIGVTENATWAADRIETLMATPYDNIGNGGPVTQGRYTINWVAAETVPAASSDAYNFKTITVTVSWQDRGNTKSVSMQHVVPIIL